MSHSEPFPPGRTSALDLFQPATTHAEVRTRITTERLNSGDRGICCWCLEPFDPVRAKERATWERGRLRSHLLMHDNGTELVCCDNCWNAAFGYAVFSHGRVVPAENPDVVPTPALRQWLREQQ